MTLFMLVQPGTREPYTFNGCLIVHTNPHELEWLLRECAYIKVPASTVEQVAYRYGTPAMWLKDHPDMVGISWPLNPKEFL